MKLNGKIIGLVAVSFFVVSAFLTVLSLVLLQTNQQQDIQSFKEEFLELGQESFSNTSSLFFYDVNNTTNTATASAQDVIANIQQIDAGSDTTIIYDIARTKYLVQPTNKEITALLTPDVLVKDIQQNVLNQTTTFNLDNFQTFLDDKSGKISPVKTQLRFYNSLGLIIGYSKSFSTVKVRIAFIQQKNAELFRTYVMYSIGILIVALAGSIATMIVFMRSLIINPLKKITSGLELVHKGILNVKIDIRSKDEIGEIARTFNTMTADLDTSRKALEEYSKTLEGKVKERTSKLESQNKTLEYNKRAMLNLLSDARELEKTLKAERDRASAIVSSMSEGLFVTDKDYRITLINHSAESLLGVTTADVKGKLLSDVALLSHGSDRTPIKVEDRPLMKSIRTGETALMGLEADIYLKSKDGNIPVSLSTAPLFSGDTVIGGIETFRDITHDQKVKETIEAQVASRTAELARQQATMSASIEAIVRAYILVDTAGNIITVNHQVNEFLGERDGGWTLAKIQEKFGNTVNILSLFNLALQEKKSSFIPEVLLGSKYFDIHVTPVFLGKSNLIGVLILIGDITEAKVLARSRDEFFSIASHELRTPLTAIRGNTSMILEYHADKLTDPDLKEMITDVHESSIRLIDIVNDFLETSRLEQGRMEFKNAPFDLAKLIENALKEYQVTGSRAHIALTFEEPVTPLPTVFADSDRVRQVLINLIGNGMKFTENGTVTISARVSGGLVQVMVTDTGRGIPIENQSILFHKFQQASDNLMTRDTTKGTGLGLYISKLMIEGMGGKIWLLSSAAGKGSTFAFTLPVAP